MTSKWLRSLLVGLPATVSVVAFSAGGASAEISQTPVETACPAGYESLSVSALEAAGPYFLAGRIDEAGNNNGYVCGHVRPDEVRDARCKNGHLNACALAELDLPIYLFTDDINPAEGAASG